MSRLLLMILLLRLAAAATPHPPLRPADGDKRRVYDQVGEEGMKQQQQGGGGGGHGFHHGDPFNVFENVFNMGGGGGGGGGRQFHFNFGGGGASCAACLPACYAQPAGRPAPAELLDPSSAWVPPPSSADLC